MTIYGHNGHGRSPPVTPPRTRTRGIDGYIYAIAYYIRVISVLVMDLKAQPSKLSVIPWEEMSYFWKKYGTFTLYAIASELSNAFDL